MLEWLHTQARAEIQNLSIELGPLTLGWFLARNFVEVTFDLVEVFVNRHERLWKLRNFSLVSLVWVCQVGLLKLAEAGRAIREQFRDGHVKVLGEGTIFGLLVDKFRIGDERAQIVCDLFRILTQRVDSVVELVFHGWARTWILFHFDQRLTPSNMPRGIEIAFDLVDSCLICQIGFAPQFVSLPTLIFGSWYIRL